GRPRALGGTTAAATADTAGGAETATAPARRTCGPGAKAARQPESGEAPSTGLRHACNRRTASGSAAAAGAGSFNLAEAPTGLAPPLSDWRSDLHGRAGGGPGPSDPQQRS